ncbi:MAG TPA: thiol:disulfide interchange protein, partial [Leeuwenhoekiella sp.]|nr:thiol:disulfide interchange protein [Leeuwenhoekiella sp.]
MIKYCSILVLLVFTLTGNAQGFGPGAGTQNPVQWEASVEKSEATSYTLKLNASIEPEWHVYSQFTDPGGSLPLELEFLEAGEAYTLEGPTEESETTTSYSDIFEVDETFFSETAQLTQKIKAEETTEYVKLILKYQVCKEVCINEEKYIVFDLSTEKGQVFQDFNEFQAYGKVQEKVEEIEPVKEVVKQEEKQDLWTIFFVAFASGFLALLTPCVFPMIPMTVSFFTKQSKNLATGRRNAILYGIFIVVIYVLLGSIVTGIFGADALNALSTNVWFNLVFFLLLVVFAISFFGAFEIMLPNSWANAVDRKADRGGIVGIFFMALALAIVSFSCTGPIVGTLLVQAASEG